MVVVGLTTDVFRQAAPIPPAGDEQPTLMDEPTLVFTGDECSYTGPRAFSVAEGSSGDIIRVALRNESSVAAFMNAWEIPTGVTAEDLVAGFPLIEDRIPPAPREVVSWRSVQPGAENTMDVLLRGPGRVGTACVPFNGEPWMTGAVLRVVE